MNRQITLLLVSVVSISNAILLEGASMSISLHQAFHTTDELKASSQALIVAAQQGEVKRVKELLAIPCINVDATNNVGDTPLIWAATMGYESIVTLLLAAHAQVNIQNKSGETALFCATLNNCTEVALELIEAGAHLDISNNDGYTPLMNAVNSDNTFLIKFLLKAQVNLYSTTKNHENALDIAHTCEHHASEALLTVAMGIQKSGIDIL